MPYLYWWLDITLPPVQADALVILSGDPSRVVRAVQIYNAVNPRVVIVSSSVAGVIGKSQVFSAAGIPTDAVYFIVDAMSTYDEARQVSSILHEQGFSSALIVTNGFHSRRALATFRCVLRNERQDIPLYITDSLEDVRYERWWEFSWTRDLVVREWIKTAYYIVHYGITCF